MYKKGGGAIVQKGLKRGGGTSRVCPPPPKSATGIYIVGVFCLGNIGFISPTHLKCPNVKWSLL